MAGRYNQETKDEVIAFIQSYNQENGRGGQSAAVKKWNLNPITVKSWLEKAGIQTAGRGGKKKKGKPGRPAGSGAKPGRKPGRKAAAAATAAAPAASDLAGKLNRMLAIQNEIAALQSEYAAIKAAL